MTRHFNFFAAVLCAPFLFAANAHCESPGAASVPASLPPKDMRAGTPKTLDTLRTFPEIKSRSEWEKRAREIREHVLVSCGLWPLPEKTPLNARIFGKIEREGYTVEKVQFQSYPGFYVAGNLYRPTGKGNGPFPGVLNPHGHWKDGRMADTQVGSIAARCINFARQGMVAFSWDMVGYNDTAQVTHKFASDPTNLLWDISLMGLQTWNSIRAVDFLESLSDVDKKRLACTGESGGGTQTFMLGAVEDRLAAQAPIVMVSHSMQGGCLCENAPGLRVDYSNMEIAAVPAPRPQILVAATGDWTKATMTVEGPALASIYRLFGAQDKLRYKIFNYDHNYNQTTREAVYAAFDAWLLKQRTGESVAEIPYSKEPDEALRVFPDGKMPEGALSESDLIASMIERSRGALEGLVPKDKASFGKSKEVLLPLWKHTMQVEFPDKGLLIETSQSQPSDKYHFYSVHIGRSGRGDRLPVMMITPPKDQLRCVVVLAHPEGKSAYLDDKQMPKGLAKAILDREQSVILLDTFLTGELANADAAAARKHTQSFFSTYNRTDLQERVQDLITTCAFAHNNAKGRKVVICGERAAGLWALLAAPAADGVIADCDSFDASDDRALMSGELFAPGIRKLGGFEVAAAIVAPNPVLIHNAGEKFATAFLEKTYAAVGAKSRLQTDSKRLDENSIAQWTASIENRSQAMK